MPDSAELHAQQRAFWNGPGGQSWVTAQTRLDAVLAPPTAELLARAAAKPGEHVFDIGCGTGTTCLALAATVGKNGAVTGLDISAPMLDLARHRGASMPNLSFVEADATTYSFTPASADLLFSRFGVMFFGEPVAAFANMRRALRPNGRLDFVCWRSLAENAWMDIPLKAVLTHVPPPPRPGPEDPGPLAFADPNRVTRILTEAGFTPRLSRFDFAVPLGNTADEAAEQALHAGPASRALRDHPDDVRARAQDAIREALQPYATPEGIALPGAAWIVEA